MATKKSDNAGGQLTLVFQGIPILNRCELRTVPFL